MSYTKSDERILETALKVQQERYLSGLPDDSELESISFTGEFEEKMRKLIRYQKNPFFTFISTTGKRVACIIIAIIVIATTTVFSVEALRKPFINFIIEIYEKYSTIIFDGEGKTESDAPLIFENHKPSYIPDGYEISRSEELLMYQFIEYTNEDGNIIMFEQSLGDNSQVGIDTENTETEIIEINTYSGIYFENKGFKTIIFSNNTYVFILTGNLEKSELIKIAESVN